MANADISLLFGVLGEGVLSGESGSLIQSQLTQIMTALNKNPLKVKVALDTENGGQKSWSSQLQKKLDALSGSNKFGIKVQLSKLTLGAGAISDFRKQLNAIVNTLNLDKGVSMTLTAEGIGEINRKMEDAGDAAADAARKTAEFKVQMEALDGQKASTRAEIEAEGAAISANITKFHEERTAAAASVATAATECAAAENAAARATEHSAAAGKDAAAAQKDLDAARKQGLTLLTQMQKAERDWTKAKNGKSSAEYGQIQEAVRQLQAYLAQLDSGEMDITTFRQRLANLNATFAASSNAIKLAGENTKTLGERIGGLAKKFSSWFSITRVIMSIVRAARKMVQNTKEIDASLTQLRIVTGATDTEMYAFLTRSTKLAKELGQSITDVLGSIETFSRLGYNLDEAANLAEFASILSNVAAVDTNTATTGLTSIIKGFNMDVSEAEHVADVLVEVGQKYAVSAGEMMEAYEKSGAALNAANTSFEKSAGLIAAANASVQNASTVGTALKTISARIRGAKSELEELGEDTSDLADGFSKYAEEIKALTGFDIMVDGSTDTYKDIYDIFEGISKVWANLSDTQQARVSEILGGTRQLQIISSILGNWGDAAGAYADAMASAGTATEANSTYMDSINGRLGTLNATFQEFSNNLLNSGLIKFFVDAGTAILNALNALEELHLLLPTVVSVVVAIKGIRAGLAAMNGAIPAAETASAINTIAAKLIAEKSATDVLAVSVANLSIAEKAELVTKIQTAVASGALTTVERDQILSTLGLVTAEGTLTVANTTLATSFKTLMASIPVWGWIALGVTALITVVTALTSSFKSNEEKLAELNEEFDSLNSTIKNISNEFKTLKESADDVIPRFAELAQGVDKFGDNISLTDDEYEEFLELNNKIAELFPELDLGLDENGNHMIALSYSADTLTESLYNLIEAQRQMAAQQIADTLPGIVENVKEQEEVYKDEKDILSDRLNYYYGAYDAFKRLYSDDSISWHKKEYGADWEEYFNEQLRILVANNAALIEEAFDSGSNAESWNRLIDKYTDEHGVIDWWSILNSDEFNHVIAGIEHEIGNIEDKIAAAWNAVHPAVSAYLQTNFLYNDMDEKMQAVARTMVSGIDFSELGLDTADQIENYISDYIINPLYDSGPEVKAAFANITDWQEELKNGEITFEEFSNRVKNAFSSLIGSMSEEDAAVFIKILVAGFNKIDKNVNDFDDVVNSVISIWGGLTNSSSECEAALDGVGRSAERVNAALSSLNTVIGDIGDLSSALGVFGENGLVAIKTLSELSGAFGNLASFGSFVNILSDPTSTMEEAQEVCNRLAAEYIEACGILDNLDESTAQFVERELEAMGVENAHELVLFRMTAARLEAILAANGQADASWDVAEKTLLESGASETAIASLKRLRQEQYNASLTAIDLTTATADSIALLIQQAQAAGAAADSLAALSALQRLQEGGYAPWSARGVTEKEYNAMLESYRRAAQIDLSALGSVSLPQVRVSLPSSSSSSSASGSSGSSKKKIEEYIADIDACYAALKRLESIQLRRADIESRIENSDDNEEKISLTKELIDVYRQEAVALENLNNLRSDIIKSNIKELEEIGFQIDYNEKTNEFFVKNLEHLNELHADSVGEYESLQEATNALRENTERLIDSLDDLNSKNQDGADSIKDLEKSVKDAKSSIVECLQELVDEASDVVDGFQDVYTTLTDGAKEYAQNGFLSVDRLQAILDLGPKYLEFLYNENGQLILNEQSLQRVIAAKTEEMAAETALSYAKQVLLSAEQAETDTLVALTQANGTASISTWNMAYATLGLAKAIGVANGMDADYFDDAVTHIQKMQSLSKTAVNSISAYFKTIDEGYINQQDGLSQILEMTKDLVRHENEEMIDALEDQKDAFADIVRLRKEGLEAAKKEGDYDDEIEEKIRQIAKLQERINTLSLDDSRDAQAERIKLEEELYKLQKELAELQADHAQEAQTEALDSLQTAFEEQKDDEIAALEDTISSEEKLYQAAIARINQGWDKLYQDLLSWNYEYGSTLQSELVSAWDAASEAVQRYGSFVDALDGVQGHTNLGSSDMAGAEAGAQTFEDANSIIAQMRQNSIAYWTATDVERAQLNASQLALAEQYRQLTGDNIKRVDGAWFHDDGSNLYSLNQSEVIDAIVSRMKANSIEYHKANDDRKAELSNENIVLGSRLGSYLGKNVYRDRNGEWWIDGRKLYEVYHRGGIAGGNATLKQDEVMAILKKGEPVLDEKREKALYRIIDFTKFLSEKLGKAIGNTPLFGLIANARSGLPDLQSAALKNITNNQSETIHFGDVYIYGANEETVDRHREVNRRFTNEVLRQLNIKK